MVTSRQTFRCELSSCSARTRSLVYFKLSSFWAIFHVVTLSTSLKIKRKIFVLANVQHKRKRINELLVPSKRSITSIEPIEVGATKISVTKLRCLSFEVIGCSFSQKASHEMCHLILLPKQKDFFSVQKEAILLNSISNEILITNI